LIKKSYIYSILLILLVPLTIVNAISTKEKSAILNSITEREKWIILDNFKEKQYELLFESDLWDYSSEYNSIFNIWKKVDIYKDIWEKTKDERIDAELKTEALIKKISSLEDSIKLLDQQIDISRKNVVNINKEVIQVNKEIKINRKTIEILKKKIKENNEILLEYLIYIYKKWNTIFDDREIDNLKSVLLNEENVWDIINDLYYMHLKDVFIR